MNKTFAMRKSFLFFAMSTLFVFSCAQEEIDINEEALESESAIQINGESVKSVVFEVPPIDFVCDELDTRAGVYRTENNTSFIWETTDTVGIYPDSGSQVYWSMESGAGTNKAEFDGGAWALKATSSYCCYYPFIGDMYLKRNSVPVSFTNQTQRGKGSFNNARFYLVSNGNTTEEGILSFQFSVLNTIIDVIATLPPGTYTKLLLASDEPSFVSSGTMNLDNKTITGKSYSNYLSIDLEDVVLENEETIDIFLMSAPVNLSGKEISIRAYRSDGNVYTYKKNITRYYEAGMRYGLLCDFTDIPNPEQYAIPEPVDLGLSVKWGSFNLGAVIPEEDGCYFAWGETETKATFTQSNYKWYDGSSFTKYEEELEQDLEIEDDAAAVNLGEGWRMPTAEEMEELVNQCTWTYKKTDNTEGYLVTGNNGNSIFLPLALIVNGGWNNNPYAYYWSSSIRKYKPNYSVLFSIGTLYFNNSNSHSLSYSYNEYRYRGATIRPVYDPSPVILSKSSMDVPLGRSVYIKATVMSSYSNNPSVDWSTDNPSVAEIDQEGLVKANGVGTATITATTKDGKYSASCPVTVREVDYSKEYLTFEFLSDGELVWRYSGGNTSGYGPCTIYYSINDGDWTALKATSVNEATNVPVSKGDVVKLKSSAYAFYRYLSGSVYNSWFYTQTPFNIYGNLLSLTYKDDFIDKPFGASLDNIFRYLFSGSYVVDAGDLIMPSSLATGCFYGLFSGCSTLTKAPKLPATALKDNCYYSMFSGCTSLTSAPELPATSLAKDCYKYMFSGCTSLEYIKAMMVNDPTIGTTDWVTNVSPSGTFVKNSNATWEIIGTNGVPEGWNIEYGSYYGPDDIPVTGVSLPESITLSVGQSTGLSATIIPSDATIQNLVWSSSNPDVVTVDSNGNLQAVSTGSATISVLTKDGNHTATCSVTVRNDIIVFADQLTKSICVGQWDTDHDGELSFSEAEAVTMIPYGVFNETAITSFDEFQYFTNVTKLEYAREIDEGETDYHGAFGHCSQLKSIVLPSSLHSLSNASFEYCTSLKKITIPVTVTSMGAMVFNGCTNLYVIMDSETPCTLVRDEYETYDSPYTFGTYNQHVKVVYVPTPEAVEAYTANTNANYYWYTCGVPVKWIGEADESLFE